MSKKKEAAGRNDADTASRCLRLALPLMTEHGIAATPANYTVCYQYVSGENAELRMALDRLLAESAPLGPDAMASLYQQHCRGLKEQELVKLKEDLLRLLSTVMQEISEMGGQTEDFGASLSRSLEDLSNQSDVGEIRQVLGKLIDQTSRMSDAGERVQGKLARTTDELKALHEEIEQARAEATHDFLTGLLNRRAFDEKLSSLLTDGDGALSLLMIDIDHFKAFNDRFGHLVGDEVLRFAANKIRDLIKGQDVAARFGGEEFTIILPRTPLRGASAVAENIRVGFAEAKLKKSSTGESLGTVTVSVGVAEYRSGEDAIRFIDRADSALYQAKRTGRNRVVTEADIPAPAAN